MDRYGLKQRPAILITGSTRGIGAAFAHLFAEKGKALVLVSGSAARLKEQKMDIASRHPVPILTIVRDLSDPWAPEEVVEEIRQRRWHIEILINNAGFNECGPFTDTNLGHELQMIQTHVGATTSLAKRLLPAMIQQGKGGILNVGSIGGLAPCPGNTVYGATNAYVLNFSDALAAELDGSGVTVTTLLTGVRRTPFAHPDHAAEHRRMARIAYRGLMQGRRRVVPGFHNRLIMMGAAIAPRYIKKRVAGWIGCNTARPAQSMVSS